MASKKTRRPGSGNEPALVIQTGSFIFPDGSRYEGSYTTQDDGSVMRQGVGTYTCSKSKKRYSGQWEMDKISGAGKIEFASGSVYTGHWKDNMYQGEGTYSWPDGSKFTGVWEGNIMQGNGRYVDQQNHHWVGQFSNGRAECDIFFTDDTIA
ncbi:hypothetical protein BJ742DRAFT_257622 [Cladochytrium replicatum]|nr:hypothetical protein BJ742DRAFT_257622 [Cladochytrium replicatum]